MPPSSFRFRRARLLLGRGHMERDSTDERFDRLEALIKAESADTRKQLRDEITLSGAKLGVRVDALHEQVKVIAEGHDGFVGHILDMKGGIERLKAGQASLVLRVSAVESRVTDVERTQKIVLAEVRSLAARR